MNKYEFCQVMNLEVLTAENTEKKTLSYTEKKLGFKNQLRVKLLAANLFLFVRNTKDLIQPVNSI